MGLKITSLPYYFETAYCFCGFGILKQLGRLASLNHNIYIAADLALMDMLHMGEPTTLTRRIMTTHLHYHY